MEGETCAPVSSPINGNRILSVLALEGTHPIFSRLISVPLTARQVLAAPSASLNYGYFITKGMACGLTVMKNGATVTDHLIGPEGFVGFSLLFGVLNDQTLIKIQPVTVVQVPGNALRIDAAAFIEEYNRPGSFQDIMRRYALARMAAITQTAACNTIHCIRERMACWLLLTADRVGTNVPVTHEAIAQMLGTRRATLSVQVEAFQRMGLITCGYKLIQIKDRSELEKVACECYEVHRQIMERVFRSSKISPVPETSRSTVLQRTNTTS